MATKINFYEKYATEHMDIDMDEQGLFCKAQSETHEHVSYTVRVDESGVVPVATSCNCPATKPCKHINLVNKFYARIYKSNAAKAEVKAEQEAQAAVAEAEAIVAQPVVERKQVWSENLCCLIWSDTREIVDPAAHEREIAAQMATWTTDISTKGNLNTARAFSLMR